MAYSYFETTVSALESAKRTVGGVDYYDLSYTTLDYTPLFSTTQLEADKYVSNVGDTLQVTLGVNTLDRSSNTDLWIVDTTNSRVTINTGDTAWSTLNPQNSDLVRLSRISKKDAPYVDYANAAVLTEQDLDAQAKQSLHIVQESIDIANDGLTKDTDGKWNAGTKVIKNVATPSSSDPSDYVATKGYVDGTSTSATVASISDEITTVAGVSTDVTAVAGAVKETIAYTVDVANSVFRILGGEFSSATEKPVLNLQKGSTYTFNYTHSSITSGSHVLGFSSTNSNTAFSGATAYTTGITNDTTSKIITFVVPSSAPSTLYYYCTNSSHNAMGNTINVAEDSIKVVADNIANVNLLGPKATEIGNLGTSTNVTNITNLNASGVIANIATVADSTYKTKVETVGDSTYKTKVETVAESTYKGKVETVAGDTTAINSIHTNIGQVTSFADTYHTAGSSAPTGSTVTTGDLWFDTSANTMKVYNGSSWASASSSIDAVASTTEYTGSQATNNKWFALTHDVGLQIVWLNGIRLVQGSDYYSVNSNSSTTNMTSGASTHIYFISNVASTDVISAMAFGQIDSTTVVPISGGTFTGTVGVGTPTASGHATTKDYVDNNTGAANEIELSNAVTLSAQTITYQKLFLGNTFTVGGNLVVNGNLILGKIIADSTAQTLSGAGYSITGTGTLTIGATLT